MNDRLPHDQAMLIILMLAGSCWFLALGFGLMAAYLLRGPF